MTDRYPRARLDMDRYIERSQTQPCFICRLLQGASDQPDHLIHRDEVGVVFLSRFPTLVGYTVVAPIEHRVGVVTDFSVDEYLRLQALVYRVGQAVSRVVPCERLYVLSLGSNQGKSHVHWHVAPLPPGVPYEEQQFRALMFGERGFLDIPQDDQSALAADIAAAMA